MNDSFAGYILGALVGISGLSAYNYKQQFAEIYGVK
jgi:hypothetical protein